ncbi:hypothetical protein DTO166G4_8781 [Paecilomyces variotii]|nr:hypothetical protein DTO166G4_8781 [Paecilomyces variotii]KAJ9233804.1 hypothetical protein DTO166G5_5560 [Paecilomyces variotii]
MAKTSKIVLITGCGEGGIGEALALEYCAKGCKVLTTVLPWERKEHLTSKGISCYTLDITQDESVRELAKTIQKDFGNSLDILVNNAGICYTMTAIDTDVEEVQKMFDVNLFGHMRMVREFHPLLIRAQGCIVNIGSVGGIVPYMYGSSYNASKAALHHWGNTLRVEMSPLGVRVLNIISGNIGTKILRRDASRTLPTGSFYSRLKEEFEAHVQRTPHTTDRHIYAKKVVPQSLRAYPPAWYWVGSTSGIVWFMDIFGFRTAWDYIQWPVFGLGKLQRETRMWLQSVVAQ